MKAFRDPIFNSRRFENIKTHLVSKNEVEQKSARLRSGEVKNEKSEKRREKL